jgi:phosphoglucosamine mutase
MVQKSPHIFRAYDIRGVYGKDLDEKTAESLGRSFGTYIGKGKKVAVSRDYRVSGEKLKKSFILGLISTGCNVVDIGIVTTPMMYFAVKKYNLDGGVQITASHNPPEWNGFKMTKEDGILCSQGFGMEEIRDIFMKEKFVSTGAIGEVSSIDISRDYTDFVLSKVKSTRKLKIVLDPGNGAACGIAEDVFRKAGHDVVVINGVPDGNFPARPSEPLEENVTKLKQKVVEVGADMGIAFDGDADRSAFVDNLGRFVWSGNFMIPIFSQHYLPKNKNAKIVFDICCSSYVEEFIKSKGGVPIASRVGHSFVMNKMLEENAIFGGEYSNHLYFSEVFGFDDALFGGLKMAEIVSSDGPFSEIVNGISSYPASKVSEIHCADDKKFDIVARIGKRLQNEGYKILDIDGVKAFDKDGNWVLIRASNTAPMIKVNSEAKTKERMQELFDYGNRVAQEEIRK